MSHDAPRRILFTLALSTGLLTLTNCSSPAAVQGGAECPILGTLANNVVAPAPGATNVPTAAGQLLLERTLTDDVKVVLYGPSVTIKLGLLKAAPSPAPSGSPLIVAFSYPQLLSNTNYVVGELDTNDSALCPPSYESNGTFTTQ